MLYRTRTYTQGSMYVCLVPATWTCRPLQFCFGSIGKTFQSHSVTPSQVPDILT